VARFNRNDVHSKETARAGVKKSDGAQKMQVQNLKIKLLVMLT
jgi:hypothetical protein